MSILNPYDLPPENHVAPVLAEPPPNYTNCLHLPECERWTIYELAKEGRLALADRGVVMSESYDDFIARVTRELSL